MISGAFKKCHTKIMDFNVLYFLSNKLKIAQVTLNQGKKLDTFYSNTLE